MKRSILPVFIPHLGCPHNCDFCDQKQIAAHQAPTPAQAAALVEAGLERARRPQIAFYGGSFTAIGREAMMAYLEAVQPFLRDGSCAGIRISTRPDAVDDEVLDLLARYGVDTIELGAQSMSDEVLREAGRGHRAADTAEANTRSQQDAAIRSELASAVAGAKSEATNAVNSEANTRAGQDAAIRQEFAAADAQLRSENMVVKLGDFTVGANTTQFDINIQSMNFSAYAEVWMLPIIHCTNNYSISNSKIMKMPHN